MSIQIPIEKKVLSENNRMAAEIRQQLQAHHIVTLNMVSSPGSGKTSLLERTCSAVQNRIRLALVAGDVQTENDAQRLLKAGGAPVRPIVTGGACHLDARMVAAAIADFDLTQIDLLIIENVGNLVCPSSYDLGEDMKVVLISTTEGDDKPLKYPAMFRRASVMVINKIDLLGTSDFELDRVKKNARAINPALQIFELSCRSGAGLESWYDWLLNLVHPC
jgi:hydrogenase nickel incorporation protein HypB